MDDAIFSFAFFFLVVILIMAFFSARRAARERAAQEQQRSSQAQASRTERQQIVEDIKATQTGRVVDQIAIIEELEGTSQNYRQYCELIGHSMESGGVTAPYSKRQVAYYDLRCYRVESTGETLIAHEKSIEPFYFTDDSCDTPVYVDIDSFGSNCVLINATDRMEGPSSDFSKALNSAVKNQGSTASSWATAGYAQFGGPGHGGRPGGPGQMPGANFGQGMPNGFGSFFGNYMPNNMGGFGGPAYHRNDTASGAEALIGVGLGMLLSSLAQAEPQGQAASTTTDPNGSFRGYHIVEDVVPLGSPVYCLGELHRNGDKFYMGKSLSATYPSSYFATKPEAELIAHLS